MKDTNHCTRNKLVEGNNARVYFRDNMAWNRRVYHDIFRFRTVVPTRELFVGLENGFIFSVLLLDLR